MPSVRFGGRIIPRRFAPGRADPRPLIDDPHPRLRPRRARAAAEWLDSGAGCGGRTRTFIGGFKARGPAVGRRRSGGRSGSRTPLAGFADQRLAARPTHPGGRREPRTPSVSEARQVDFGEAKRRGTPWWLASRDGGRPGTRTLRLPLRRRASVHRSRRPDGPRWRNSTSVSPLGPECLVRWTKRGEWASPAESNRDLELRKLV
jgi:hypothetical protein